MSEFDKSILRSMWQTYAQKGINKLNAWNSFKVPESEKDINWNLAGNKIQSLYSTEKDINWNLVRYRQYLLRIFSKQDLSVSGERRDKAWDILDRERKGQKSVLILFHKCSSWEHEGLFPCISFFPIY